MKQSVFPSEPESPIASYNNDEDMVTLSQPTLDFIPPLSFPVSLPPPSVELQIVDTKPSLYEEALGLFERGNYVEAAGKLKEDIAVSRSAESLALLARICAN